MFEYLKLTPAFQHWMNNQTDDFDWRDYQVFFSRVDKMVCYIDIFWPNFIMKGGVFIKESSFPDDFDEFVFKAKESNWTDTDIEYNLNHIHVSDIFINDPDRDLIDVSVFRFIANTIALMWRCRLDMLYPGQKFAVGVANEDVSPEVYAYAIRE